MKESVVVTTDVASRSSLVTRGGIRLRTLRPTTSAPRERRGTCASVEAWADDESHCSADMNRSGQASRSSTTTGRRSTLPRASAAGRVGSPGTDPRMTSGLFAPLKRLIPRRTESAAATSWSAPRWRRSASYERKAVRCTMAPVTSRETEPVRTVILQETTTGVVRAGGQYRELMTTRDQRRGQPVPAPLRGADLGGPVVDEEKDPHASPGSMWCEEGARCTDDGGRLQIEEQDRGHADQRHPDPTGGDDAGRCQRGARDGRQGHQKS